MTVSEKTAKIIRTVTIPPVFIGLLLISCFVRDGAGFAPAWLFALIFFFEVLTPVLAYPIQHFVPKLRETGRDGQRKLAFVLTAVGYCLSFVCALVFKAGHALMFIAATYFSAAALLAIVNKLKIKASGHACSVIGTMVFFIWFFGPKLIVPCVIASAATMWASLKLKRHTAKEFVLGALCGGVAFCCCLIIL